MITFSLNSGSNGNAIYVEALGVRLLFDAGISGRQAAGRLRVHNRTIENVDAVILSHDHGDHIRCAGVYHRRFNLPLYMTSWTHCAIWNTIGPVADPHYFTAGEPFHVGPLIIHTIKTPHDAADPVAFVIQAGHRRLGILTDLGHAFPELHTTLESLDAAYVEANYEPLQLEESSYPRWLKDRIQGKKGHLSNHQAAQLVSGADRKLQWIALAHLSEHCNTPETAVAVHRRSVRPSLPIHVAPRHRVSTILEVA